VALHNLGDRGQRGEQVGNEVVNMGGYGVARYVQEAALMRMVDAGRITVFPLDFQPVGEGNAVRGAGLPLLYNYYTGAGIYPLGSEQAPGRQEYLPKPVVLQQILRKLSLTMKQRIPPGLRNLRL